MTSEPLPPPVAELIQHRDEVYRRYPLFQSYRYRKSKAPKHMISAWLTNLLACIRKPYFEDTPSASLYRIYEFLVVDWNTQLRNELEYFCCVQPSWSVSDIPDPADPDPLRYAILAVITKLMCIAFNRRIDLGLPRDAPAVIEDFEELAARPRRHEHPPSWANLIKPLPETVFIPDETGMVSSLDDRSVSAEFKEMNIIIGAPHIHFI